MKVRLVGLTVSVAAGALSVRVTLTVLVIPPPEIVIDPLFVPTAAVAVSTFTVTVPSGSKGFRFTIQYVDNGVTVDVCTNFSSPTLHGNVSVDGSGMNLVVTPVQWLNGGHLEKGCDLFASDDNTCANQAENESEDSSGLDCR